MIRNRILSLFIYIIGGVTLATAQDKQQTVTGSIWGNWFVQAGLDMTLQNPYGCNFSQVFPKEKHSDWTWLWESGSRHMWR